MPEAGRRAAARWSAAPSSPWAPCSRARAWRRCYASLEHLDLFSIGLNCATGPEFMTDHLRVARRAGHVLRQRAYPNAGLPDEHGQLPRDAGEPGRSSCGASSRRAGSTWSAAAAAPRRRTSAALAAARAAAGRRACPRRAARRAVSGHRGRSTWPTTTARCSSASAPTSSARGKFKELIVDEQVRGGRRDRPRPGQGRRPGARRLPRQPGPRRARRHGPLPRRA